MDERGELIAQAEKKVVEMAEHYRLPDGVPYRIVMKLSNAVEAQTLEELRSRLDRAVSSMQIHCLAAWGSKQCPGPLTPENLEKQAAKRESLGKWKWEKGEDDQAEQNFKAAEKLRKQAAKLRKTLRH